MRIWKQRVGFAVAFMLGAACQGTALTGPECGLVAEGGCVDKGTAVDQCGDRSCRALYQCVAEADDPTVGQWVFARECPELPPEEDASSPIVDAGNDARVIDQDALPDDLPPGAHGGAGCLGLQMPDCPLALAYACSECCGCEDLFVCVNGGWEVWGACIDGQPTAF